VTEGTKGALRSTEECSMTSYAPTRRTGACVWLAVSAAACGLLQVASSPIQAEPRDVFVRFMAPTDPVDGYRLYLFDQHSGIEHELEVGFIEPDGAGVGELALKLDSARSYEVQMTAYNASGESSRSNAVQVAAEAAPDPLRVDPILGVFQPGVYDLVVTGSGFTRKPKIKFENGEGKAPKLKVRQVIDSNRLLVQLKVKHKKLYGETTWDMRVRIKGGDEIVVPAALSVEPL